MTTQMDDAPVILYVEDNVDNRKLVDRVLRAAGFDVHGVMDGLAALEFLKTHTPDLILMDINLPNIDGYTMTRQLRKQERLVKIPIIALTASVTKQDQEKSKEAGCDGFIQKPIDVELLPDQIHMYLSRKMA